MEIKIIYWTKLEKKEKTSANEKEDIDNDQRKQLQY